MWKQTHINSHSPKIILFWTKYYNSSDFHFGLGSHPFSKAGCSSSNCKLTNDRKLLNQSDAIIFHTNEIDDSDLPQVRYPHQKWIFYTFIPPMHYKALPETLAVSIEINSINIIKFNQIQSSYHNHRVNLIGRWRTGRILTSSTATHSADWSNSNPTSEW